MTWALSIVAGTIGLIFVALFTAFSRPDVGLILAAVLASPLILFAWLGQIRLERRAHEFEREFDAYQTERGRLSASLRADATNQAP